MSKPQQASKLTTPYTEHHKELCFKAWYSAGRPDKIPQIKEIIPDDEHGRIPSDGIILKWRDELGWDVRADELDVKANAIVDDEMVNFRVLMLKEQASRGKELQVKGMYYLRKHEFDTSASAVSAIIKGADLERISRGLSERLTRLSQLSDDKLIGEVQKLLDIASESGEIIDAEEIDDDKDI